MRTLTGPLLLLLLIGCAADEPLGGQAIVYGEAPPPDPPAIRAEAAPAPPTPRHVWLGGSWAWTSDGYAWTPGQWAVPPREGAVWVSPRWVVRGRHHIFVSGYWR